MLTVEMKINGTLIGQIYAHNKGFNHDNNTHEYKYHMYQMGMDGEPVIKEGWVSHYREDGFNKLISIILEDMEL